MNQIFRIHFQVTTWDRSDKFVIMERELLDKKQYMLSVVLSRNDGDLQTMARQENEAEDPVLDGVAWEIITVGIIAPRVVMMPILTTKLASGRLSIFNAVYPIK